MTRHLTRRRQRRLSLPSITSSPFYLFAAPPHSAPCPLPPLPVLLVEDQWFISPCLSSLVQYILFLCLPLGSLSPGPFQFPSPVSTWTLARTCVPSLVISSLPPCTLPGNRCLCVMVMILKSVCPKQVTPLSSWPTSPSCSSSWASFRRLSKLEPSFFHTKTCSSS